MAILLHMPKETTKEQQVLDLARKAKILRVHELSEKGNHPEHLRRLYQRGMLVRMGRCEKSSDPGKGFAAASDSGYSHFPLRHLFLKGSPEQAAIAGGIRNAPISITTWPSVLLSTSSLPLRTKALHSACLVGSSLNSSVRPRGV